MTRSEIVLVHDSMEYEIKSEVWKNDEMVAFA